ncbi:MAG: HD domain-containing phosphohydrolase [Actinomycetota bacterium]|nr:HD domain-containing phosphohydrolase [Actinomycetota bacterium]
MLGGNKNPETQFPTHDVQADGAGTAISPRPSGLVAKPSLLEAVGKEALDSQDLKVISERALDYLSRYFHVDTIMFLVKRLDKLDVLVVRGANADSLLGSEYPIEGSMASLLEAVDGPTLNVPDLSFDAALGFKDKLTGRLVERGAVSLLMTAVGQSGLLALAASRLNAFTKMDEAAIEGVAFQLGYVAETIRQSSFLKQSADEFNKLLNSINQVNAGENLAETLRSTLASAVELTGANSGSFLLFDETKEVLSLEAAVGLPESAIAVEVKLGEGIAGWVAAHRKPVMIKDLDEDAAAQSGLGPDQAAVALALPVLLGDKLVGVLNLGSTRAGYTFTTAALNQVVKLLGQTGAAIVAGQAGEAWQSLYVDTVKALAQVIESRDPFSPGHAVDVSGHAGDLARAMRLSEDNIHTIELAGLLHDIGTAAITDNLFRQERPLNSVERLLIRSHPRLGAKALSEITRLHGVLPIILHHHENFDGSGYAEGLKGDEIPLGARILAVAEAYCAMTAERPYRPAKTSAEAIDELRRGAGTQFDSQIVYVFCNLVEKELRL